MEHFNLVRRVLGFLAGPPFELDITNSLILYFSLTACLAAVLCMIWLLWVQPRVDHQRIAARHREKQAERSRRHHEHDKTIVIYFAATLSAIATLNVFSGTLWEPIRVAVETSAPAGAAGVTINQLLPIMMWLAVAAFFTTLAYLLDNRFNNEKQEGK